MVYSVDLSKAYFNLSNDERISVWHSSIYTALLYLWSQNNFTNRIPITRKVLMRHCHISSIATYHKCIKELQEFGYIKYVPTYNSFFGSYISILIAE